MSAFFGQRAPELVPEIVNDLNIHPAFRRKLPLKERSQSDLNAINNKNTVRLVKDDQDSSSIYTKSPLSTKHSKTIKQVKSREAIFVENPRPTVRPISLDGYSMASNRPFLPNRKPKRFSASTTTSNADTLVADSLLSPTSQRFSGDYSKQHHEQLAPLQELSSEAHLPVTSDAPDIPELSSMPARPWHVPHSSSCYSSTPWDDARPPTPPRSASRGMCVAPVGEVSDPALGSGQEWATGSTQDRGTPHLIRYKPSIDGIQAQYASVRPAVKHARSMSSLWTTESDEEAESLHVPRKRAHIRASSLSSHPSMPFDSVPASPDQRTRTRRRALTSSSYSGSISPPIMTRAIHPSSSYASIGEALHSSDSAVPEPLFTSTAPLPQGPFEPSSNHYSTEMDDTICELQVPQLREKRSGYMRPRRSHTDLRGGTSRSNQSGESDRWSTGTVIFPQWAKFFYTGRLGLMSNNQSRVTLAGPPYSHTPLHSQMTLAGPQYSALNHSHRSLIDMQYPFDRLHPILRHQPSRADTLNSYISRPESSLSNWETVYSESDSNVASPIPGFRGRQRSQTDIRFVTPDGSIRPRTRRRMSNPELLRDVHEDYESDVGSEFERPIESRPGPSKLSRHVTVRNSVMSGFQAVTRTRSNVPEPKQSRSRPSLPRLVQNSRLVRNLSAWRVPSIDEPFPADILGPVNRQIVCFCLGFMFPPLWLFAAFLSVPQVGQSVREKPTSTAANDNAVAERQWNWDEERRVLKAKWWRNLNRGMSVIGIGIVAVIIALAVLAARG